MATELERQLADLKQGDHACPIYESTAEQMAVAVPFIKEGLARGERCLYIADSSGVTAILAALTAAGVDVAHECSRSALLLLTERDAYLKSGGFDPQALIDFWRRAEAQALAEGFAGLRVTGEMTWALGPGPGNERLIEYEALLNQYVVNSRAVILCQYNRARFDAAVIHDVLRTHPVAILGELVCPNPYYEPPELVLSAEPAASAEFKAKRVDWWIAQLKRARAAEQERARALEKLKQSERRLAEAQQVAHLGSWERDLRTNQVIWSDELYRLFGLRAHEIDLSYQQFLNLVLPQDVARIRLLVDEAIRERRRFNFDYRIPLADGGVRMLNDRGSIILNEEGEPIRLVGTAQDVTELRQAEQALQEYAARLQALSRRLLEVQEAERRHLARELHDEVGQTLTGLRFLLTTNREVSAAEAEAKLQQARGLVEELLERVRGLSVDLRPASLDQLGLLPALHALFERYNDQTGVRVNFQHAGVERRFAPELETAAYRIVQEALTNVARHARVSEAAVRIWADAETLNIQVEDQGAGFDPGATLAASSGGLPGMRERVTLLAGRLTVESNAGGGTYLLAELPLGGRTGGEDR